MNRQQAVQHVVEHSGCAHFTDGAEGALWVVESVREDARSGAATGYEIALEKRPPLTLAFTRLTPTSFEAGAHLLAVDFVRDVTRQLKAPDHARERLTASTVERIASRIIEFAQRYK